MTSWQRLLLPKALIGLSYHTFIGVKDAEFKRGEQVVILSLLKLPKKLNNPDEILLTLIVIYKQTDGRAMIFICQKANLHIAYSIYYSES